MRVERLQQELELDIVYRHFPLHPETPKNGLTLEELFAGRNIDLAAAKARMAQLMADEGLPYGERTMTYNSRLAQELGKWADTTSLGENLHLALFQAYFVDNVNLADVDKLVSVARRVGLPESEAREVLARRSFREDVDTDWTRSRQLGITGVPAFVIDGKGLVGAQPYEQLETFALSAGASRRR